MSARTPGLQPRSQYHSYWGKYNWAAGGSDPGAANLPNDTAAGGSFIEPFYSQLEVGDTASTDDASVVNRGLWVCVYKGTVGGNDAQWRRLDNGVGATQTIRDAHVMVVAQEGTLAPLGALVDPNKAANNYNLTAAGDVVSITCDYLDAGNGVQLEKALLVADAAALQIDIRLRPCSIVLVNAELTAVPLRLPSQCRLIGGGRWMSFIGSDTVANASQEILYVEQNAEVMDLSFNSGTSAGTPGAGASKAMIVTEAFARIERCLITMDGTARYVAAAGQPWAIWDSSATIEVLDCKFFGASQTSGAAPSIAIALGADPAVAPNTFTAQASFRINGCHLEAGAGGGFNRAVYAYNVGGGGHVSECDFLDITRPQLGAIRFDYGGVAGAVTDVLPTVNDVRITVAITENPTDAPYGGVAIIDALNSVTATVLSYFEWTAVRVFFKPNTGTPFVVERAGYLLNTETTSATSSTKIEGGIINGCSVLGDFNNGVFIFADDAGGGVLSRVTDIRIGNCLFKNPVAIGGSAFGIHVKTAASAAAAADAIGIANCDCKNAPATGTGISIDQGAGSTLSNTIVLGNNLTASGGTAFTDTGTGTEAAHNIL